MPPPSANQPLIYRLQTLVKHPQFVWWIGHLCVILCTSLYYLSFLTLSLESARFYYYWVYRGAVLSYSVVVYKLYGFPRLDWDYFQRINRDENVFYLALAVVWFFNPPIFVTPIPYATFSLFHLITYFRSFIIPAFVPAAASSAVNSNSPATGNAKTFINISKGIQNWVLKNYEVAMRTVSFAEVVVITTSLLTYILIFKVRVFTLFLYLTFLRFRYHMNPYTKDAFSNVRQRLDVWLLPPTADSRIPPYVTKAYRHLKTAITYFGQLQSQQPSAR
ncbi:4668_t:CDS:2 [Ambispora gerdemannii]|uniref:4668_t:CDS:1 n=1 Tax=Ambispora gerdemannii TaxID=144530 RepID=A0A9N9CZN4_9GLOM|nr:4668_t:CDS:2 [Ambispora gerdemannii]